MGVIATTLLEHDLLWLILAVYLGTVSQNFFEALVNDIIWPILDAVFDLNTLFKRLSFPLEHNEVLKFGALFRAALKMFIGGLIILGVIYIIKKKL